nr:alpha/beta hydrolase [Zhihengliuella sp.]
MAENADVFAQLPSHLHAALVREYIAGAVSASLSPQDIDVLASPWLDSSGQTAFYQQIASLKSADTRPVAGILATTRCPSHIGWGRDDPWIPVQQTYELQSKLAGDPEVVVLDGVGHLSPYEDPPGVTAALREWLTRSRQSPGGS